MGVEFFKSINMMIRYSFFGLRYLPKKMAKNIPGEYFSMNSIMTCVRIKRMNHSGIFSKSHAL